MRLSESCTLILYRLVSNDKKVFFKSSTRINHFKKKIPNIPLPPATIVTRWVTSLSAALYYVENISSVKSPVDVLDEDDALSIEIVRNLLKDIIKQVYYYSCLLYTSRCV